MAPPRTIDLNLVRTTLVWRVGAEGVSAQQELKLYLSRAMDAGGTPSGFAARFQFSEEFQHDRTTP